MATSTFCGTVYTTVLAHNHQEFNDVPRYLIRVFSPGSDGYNSPIGFWSMSKANELGQFRNLTDLPKNQVASMLLDHVLWRSYRTRMDDILISFTPSLLFALQHCIRKMATRPWNTSEDNCMIAIIDTSRFPKNTFKRTVELLEEYGLDETTDSNLRHTYHEAEYLAQYELNLYHDPEASVCVSFRSLMYHDRLFELLPDLKDEASKKLLYSRLQELRVRWFQMTRPPLTSNDVALCHSLGLCFGGKWKLIVTVWFLAMRFRDCEEDVLLKEFGDGFHGTVTDPHLFGLPNSSIPDSLLELEAWDRLMKIIIKVQRRRARGDRKRNEDDLNELLDNLKLH